MRKLSLISIVVCILVFALSACGGTKGYDMTQLSGDLLDSEAFSDILSPVDIKIGAGLYGFDSADVGDYVLYCSTRATTEEIGMFKCVDETAAQRVLESAQARAQSQKAIYESYAPAEPPKLDDGYIKADGVYVFYIISANGDTVREIMK